MMKCRVFGDKQIKNACKLRGVPFGDISRIMTDVIPGAFNGELVRVYRKLIKGLPVRLWVVYCRMSSPLIEVAHTP